MRPAKGELLQVLYATVAYTTEDMRNHDVSDDLTVSDLVTYLSPTRNGYLRVLTSNGNVGWISDRNVRRPSSKGAT